MRLQSMRSMRGPWTGKTPSICPRPNSPCAPTWPAASRCGSSAWAEEQAVRKACWRRARREAPSLRAARRAALPDRRHPLRHAAQQGPEGHHRPLAPAHGQARALRAGLGLPRPAHRAAGRKAARRPKAQAGHRASSASKCEAHARKFVDVMRARVHAAGLLRQLGRALPDAVQGLRGHHRARAGGVRARRTALSRQAAGALVHHAPDRAGRGGGRVRRPRLAVDLRALPGASASPRWRPILRQDAGGAGHLDHHAVDAGREPGHRGESRARVRRDPDRAAAAANT